MGFFGNRKLRKESAVDDQRIPGPQDQSMSQPWYPQAPYQSQATFQPAGLLPPPPGWSGSVQPPPPYQGPIIVNQHYYLAPPPGLPQRPHTSGGPLSKFKLGSMVNLAEQVCPGTGVPQLIGDNLAAWNQFGAQLATQSAGLCDQLSMQSAGLYDQLSTCFNDVMTMVEQGQCTGNEKDLCIFQPGLAQSQASLGQSSSADREPRKRDKKERPKDHPKGQTTAVASSLISGNYFAKVDLYANSRLPLNLPPLKLYLPTYPLLCLAAQYSNRVYEVPKGAERDTHIDADWRAGTKAMVIKSVPMDYMNTIVFAIRGTASFMDWSVNLNMEPTSPAGFLDDPGNFCHAGFLSVARKMVHPVAKRLRQLLEEDPSRAASSLLITGHSAGGAVAALLYSHMLSSSKGADSELRRVADRFRRVHCITFGCPPVSLLPLDKPTDYERRPQLRKSLFMSFVNEGDPVARADKAYVRSLLELFAAPAPAPVLGSGSSKDGKGGNDKSKCGSTEKMTAPKEKRSKASLASAKSNKSGKSASPSIKPSSTSGYSTASKSSTSSRPIWKVPPSTLSNAGRIVVLRSGNPKARLRGKQTVEERLNEGVVAHTTTDEQLRGVIWGDPVAHVMRLYSGRIETLAVGAVTAKGY